MSGTDGPPPTSNEGHTPPGAQGAPSHQEPTVAPPSSPTTPTTGASFLTTALLVLAVALHLAAGWLVSVSGLLAPLWAILVLAAGWLGACVLLARAVRGRRRWAPLVPLGVVAAWGALMTFGDLVLGWTA